MPMIYLNNAATSYPKPDRVITSVSRALTEVPADSGRDSGNGSDPRSSCRESIARLFHVSDPARVVILPSATYALNLVVSAMLGKNDHVVTTELEHNSLLRPLAHLAAKRGVRVTHVPPNGDGRVPWEWIEDSISSSTRLVAVSHACNVSGAIQDVRTIAGLAAEAGVPFLIDASQSAGAIDMDHSELPGRVFIAFAGHKGLLGPTGVGGLIVPDAEVPQTIVGGTGVRSENEFHPEELPLRHEAGTPNYPGIAGLDQGVQSVLERGVETEGRHRAELVSSARDRLRGIDGIRLVPLPDEDGRAGIVCFNLDGFDPNDLAHALSSAFDIHTRAGLHCAPMAHHALGTAPFGTVRASVGWANTLVEIEGLEIALRQIGGSGS